MLPSKSLKDASSSSSSTLAQASTSNARVYVPFWNESCKAESKLLWSPTGIGSVASASNSSTGYVRNMVPKSWFSIRQSQTPLSHLQKTSWLSSQSFRLARMVCGSTNAHLKRSLETKSQTNNSVRKSVKSKRTKEQIFLDADLKKKERLRVQLLKQNNRDAWAKEKKEQQFQMAKVEFLTYAQPPTIQQFNATKKQASFLQQWKKWTNWWKRFPGSCHGVDPKVIELVAKERAKEHLDVNLLNGMLGQNKTRKRKAPSNEYIPNKRISKAKSKLTLYPERQRTLHDVIEDLKNPDLELEPRESIVTYKFKLRPTTAQKKILRSYMGVYRYTYNELVALRSDPEKCATVFSG